MEESPALNTSSYPRLINPLEEALQALCKQLIKSHLFRGYYTERRHVLPVSGYRDIVVLQRSEREMEKLLLTIKEKLHLFYQNMPNKWIGITTGSLDGTPPQTQTLETRIWAELDDLAFGQYWFAIKTVRFRDNEIILKLKALRPVEDEPMQRRSLNAFTAKTSESSTALVKSSGLLAIADKSNESAVNNSEAEPQIALDDFVKLIQSWGTDIKQTVYNFMSNDISKQNIKGLLQFLGLLTVTLLSGSVVAIKYLGIFTLRLLFELSRFTHVMTPIILKLIEAVNKIIGGFYILLAMIWRDVIGNRNPAKAPMPMNALKYDRPQYKSIKAGVTQRMNLPTSYEGKYQ